MNRIYAIGDIHGQLAMLQAAHDLIAQDKEVTGDSTAPVVHLGDYCDRGPHTKDVIDLLIAGKEAGHPWRFVKGNHDRMMWLYLQEPSQIDPILRTDLTWLHERLGGTDTLKSYGLKSLEEMSDDERHSIARDVVPSSHMAFLHESETIVETEDLVFCHAGIRPGIAFEDQTEDDLTWIRKEFHDDKRDHGKLIIHGHTPVPVAEHSGNRVNLDTGAGYGKTLTVAVFEGRKCWTLSAKGRVPLVHSI